MGDSKKPPKKYVVKARKRDQISLDSEGPGNRVNEFVCRVECFQEKIFSRGQELWFKISENQLLALFNNEIIGHVLEPEKEVLENYIENNIRFIGSIIDIEKRSKIILLVQIYITDFMED